MEFPQLKQIIEAALLASNTPMSTARLGGLFTDEDNISTSDIGRALQSLREACEGRGVELVEVASGFRYQVRQEVHPWVARMWTERPSRYSRALLETLALIAYRQPITRGEIESVRGVSVSSNIIKTLEEREWIRVVGHRDVPGRPGLYGTTREFLDHFNLKSLDELPSLAEIRDMEDFDPQLNFDANAPAQAHAALSDETSADDVDADLADANETGVHAGDNDVGAAPSRAPSGDTQEAASRHDEDAVRTDRSTADEAKAQADVDTDTADTDTKENRA